MKKLCLNNECQSPSANQRPRACSAPRVLPRFSKINSDWLLDMAVLSCTVIGRVDLVEWWLCSRWIPDTQNKHFGDHEISVARLKQWKAVQFELSDNEQRESVKVLGGAMMSLLISLTVSENLWSFDACRLSGILFILNQNRQSCPVGL